MGRASPFRRSRPIAGLAVTVGLLGVLASAAPVASAPAGGVEAVAAGAAAVRELRDLTPRQYDNIERRHADEGFRLVRSERYETAAGPRYAGTWRRDSDRPSWPLRERVTALVQAEQDRHDVPGISVAIVERGRLRFLRGFGHADRANDVWLDSSHVLGLASVSKAVTGVLALRLAEQGAIGVDEPTRRYLPSLPAHHTHTLRQLADNRGCVQHYDEGRGFGPGSYATARAAARPFESDPLVCEVGAYHYSTHGYTLLCAALEAATGQSAADLVESRLTGPLGLGTLRPERPVGSAPPRGVEEPAAVRRSRVYDAGNNAFPHPDRTAKLCGGGMESSVRDLAWFGHRLAAGELLSPASMDAIWGGPAGSGYRFGWEVGTLHGRPVIAKSGANAGARSYLRIHPHAGVVVAVLSNRVEGGHDVARLGTQLGELVLRRR